MVPTTSFDTSKIPTADMKFANDDCSEQPTEEFTK